MQGLLVGPAKTGQLPDPLREIMNAELAQIVKRVKARYQSNPPEDDDLLVDAGTLLQIEILQSGVEFSETDVLQAATLVGLPEGELIDWLEEMASWV